MSVKSLLARSVLFSALICIALQRCAFSGLVTRNEVCDSEMQRIEDCWDTHGTMRVYPGLGPTGSAIIYYAGTGSASGYRNRASFFAEVIPGQTYTFSAYVDGTGHLGTPPYIILSAANGTWMGASTYQPGKGRVSLTFTIPRDAGTTIIKGSFSTENGLYPLGRGAALSQPQVENGAIAHGYVPSNDPAWTSDPPSGNLVAQSDPAGFAPSWTFDGAMRSISRAGPDGHSAIIYRGSGRPSGYDSYAAFLARVTPGSTYTFSAYVDGSEQTNTPPYVILSAVNGTWQGASLYQTERGRVFATFTIPSDSNTTLLRGTFSTENGTYARDASATFAQPQIESGEFPHAYALSDDSVLGAPPGGNQLDDSELRRSPAWTLGGAMRQVPHGFPDGTSALVYRGNGRPSGFGVIATVRARVQPGSVYTLSAYINGQSHVAMPPYMWVSPVNGTWGGAHTYQPGVGLTPLTFAVPAGSNTTCVTIEFSTQNGAYPTGTSLAIAEPQLAVGTSIYHYVATDASGAQPPSQPATSCM